MLNTITFVHESNLLWVYFETFYVEIENVLFLFLFAPSDTKMKFFIFNISAQADATSISWSWMAGKRSPCVDECRRMLNWAQVGVFLSHDEQSSSQSCERCYRKTSAVVVAARKRRRERKKRKFVPAAAKHSPNTKILLPQFEIILLRNSCFPLFPNTLPPFPIPTHFDHISTLVSNVSPFTLR